MLIVIGIIGIIADMTIPTLVSNYQKQLTVVRLQKIYSEISQALKLAEVDNGPMEYWDFSAYEIGKERNDYVFDNFLAPYIKIIKKCDPQESGCWKDSATLSNKTGYCLVGSWETSSFVTASGYAVWFRPNTLGNELLTYIDVDGPDKGKSIQGKDIFMIYTVMSSPDNSMNLGTRLYGFYSKEELSRDTLKNDSNSGCNKTSKNRYAGFYCAALIQTDGWKIADDYPW